MSHPTNQKHPDTPLLPVCCIITPCSFNDAVSNQTAQPQRQD